MGRLGRWVAAIVYLTGTAEAAMAETPAGGLVIDPQRVEIGLTFTGATIAVRAEVPAGYEAALRLLGHAERQELKKLGKKAHVLWMKVGDISLDAVPLVYQVLTSAPLGEMASPAALAQWTLGYDLLIPETALSPDLRGEFVRLKEHDGLFAMHEGGLAMAGAPDDSSAVAGRAARRLQGTFRLPARVQAGDYVVDLIGFREHEATHLGRAVLRLEHVGAVKQLQQFALGHGLAYGIAASLIAIAAGLLTGLLLRPKPDESH
jgi:hypothetical protein